jgi:hypothetical protein
LLNCRQLSTKPCGLVLLELPDTNVLEEEFIEFFQGAEAGLGQIEESPQGGDDGETAPEKSNTSTQVSVAFILDEGADKSDKDGDTKPGECGNSNRLLSELESGDFGGYNPNTVKKLVATPADRAYRSRESPPATPAN